MPRKNSYITVTDQFCGAGGSSQGVRRLSQRTGGGLEVKLALNHWKLAIETHNTNFPDTLHDCTDISACDPRRYISTDILITSPECTNHSLAKGVKTLKKQMDMFSTGVMDAAAERSRATMWDVCRFAEYHKYNCIIVENVVDARKWVLFDAWLTAMHALGYNHKCVYLNSMHCHPTPQSRDRMYIVFWKKGNKAPNLNYTPVGWCYKCSADVQAVQAWKPEQKTYKYKTGYLYCCPACSSVVEPYYHAAFNCIDWSDIGTRIGDRERPLSANTIKRIEYGLKKYGGTPFQFHTSFTKSKRNLVRSLNEPAFTHTTIPSQAFIVNDQHSTGIDFRVKSIGETVQGITTQPHFKVIMPFVFKAEHSHGEASGKVKSTAQAFQTQTTRQSSSLVVPPYIIEMNRTGECKPSSEPTATLTAGGINHAMLTPPFIPVARGQSKAHSSADPLSTQSQMINHGIVTSEAWNSFIAQYYNGSHCTKHITEEVGTVSTNDRSALVSYKEPALEDCYYRMLKPHEIKLAMAFDKDYIVLGSGKYQVKQLGNAVTPPAMEWLVGQCVESLS